MNWSIRRIARTLGVNRRTEQRYANAAPPKCTSKVIAGSDAADALNCTTLSQVITGPRSFCGAFREVFAPMRALPWVRSKTSLVSWVLLTITRSGTRSPGRRQSAQRITPENHPLRVQF